MGRVSRGEETGMPVLDFILTVIAVYAIMEILRGLAELILRRKKE